MCLRRLWALLALAILAPGSPAAAQVRGGSADDVLAQPFSNPCEDGFYYDLSSNSPFNLCKPLERPVGFARLEAEAALPSSVLALATCSASSLTGLVATLAQTGGGTIRLPECTLILDRSILLPSNTVLQGAGENRTVLVAAPGFDQEMIRVAQARNVVVRDLTLDGRSSAAFGLRIEYSDNVLAERLEARSVVRNGLHFSNSTRVTLRYNRSHGQALYSGLSSKDCYAESIRDLAGDPALVVTQALCEDHILDLARRHGGLGPGALWTSDYSVYSNFLHDNADYGLVLHGGRGEVAGNLVSGNRECMKFPDASDVWVHHNACIENHLFGAHVYAVIVDRFPSNILFYENVLTRNGEYALRLEGARNIYLVNNHYEDNGLCAAPCESQSAPGGDALLVAAKDFGPTLLTPSVFACPGSQDVDLPAYGGYAVTPLPYYQRPCTTFILPIEFVSFSAESQPDGVVLSWETESQVNTSGFHVEHRLVSNSPAFPTWEDLAYIEGHGTTPELHSYSHRITGLPPGVHSFRLKHVDFDGSFTYSQEVEVALTLPGLYFLSPVYPNPMQTSGAFDLSVAADQEARITVVDVLGRVVRVLHDGSLQRDVPYRFSVEGESLAPGSYQVVVEGTRFLRARGFTKVGRGVR